MALRVSCSKRLQQSSLLAARSIGKQAVPFGKCGAQLAPPRLEVAEPSFEGDQLLGGQLHGLDGRARRHVRVRGKMPAKSHHRKTDRQRTSNQLHANQGFSRK